MVQQERHLLLHFLVGWENWLLQDPPPHTQINRYICLLIWKKSTAFKMLCPPITLQPNLMLSKMALPLNYIKMLPTCCSRRSVTVQSIWCHCCPSVCIIQDGSLWCTVVVWVRMASRRFICWNNRSSVVRTVCERLSGVTLREEVCPWGQALKCTNLPFVVVSLDASSQLLFQHPSFLPAAHAPCHGRCVL